MTFQPFGQLSWAKAEFLGGRRLPMKGNLKPYLMRAVYYNDPGPPSHGFHVDRSKRNDLLVTQGSSSHDFPDMRRSALIVPMPFRPSRIFLETGVFN